MSENDPAHDNPAPSEDVIDVVDSPESRIGPRLTETDQKITNRQDWVRSALAIFLALLLALALAGTLLPLLKSLLWSDCPDIPAQATEAVIQALSECRQAEALRAREISEFFADKLFVALLGVVALITGFYFKGGGGNGN